jgi:putative heme iron utilization protein
MLISSMAMHTQNLLADPRATLLVTAASGAGDMLGAGRVSLMGDASRVGAAGGADAEAELAAARECYLAGQPEARQWIDFDDFSLWRLEVLDVYFVGGFGVMGWVEAADYLAASPDPLCRSGPAIIEHMNTDHAEALVLLARHAGHEAETAQMTAVDRLGFHLRLQTAEGPRGTRLNFPRESTDANQCRENLVQMTKAARGAR